MFLEASVSHSVFHKGGGVGVVMSIPVSGPMFFLGV